MEKEKKLEQVLKTELKAESERILEEMASDDSLKDVFLPEGMEHSLKKGIQELEEARASYERLSDEDKAALRLGREMLALGRDTADTDVSEEDYAAPAFSGKITRFRKKSRKAVALAFIAASMVLAVGMTSIGGAPFLIEIGHQIIGGKEETKVDSGREGESERNTDVSEEDKAYEGIKEKFSITPVRLQYLPDETEFLDCEIDEDLVMGCILYQCGKDVIEYQIVLNYQNAAHSYGVEDQTIKAYDMQIGSQVVHIKQHMVSEDRYAYTAEFEYKNVFYTINSMIEKAEFEKIIKNLYFF